MTFEARGSYKVVREAKHRCFLRDPDGMHGAIIECPECGKWWRAVEPGNPKYAKWVRAWVRQLFSRREND